MLHRVFINTILDLPVTNTNFPGSLPVSLQRDFLSTVLVGEEKNSRGEYTVAFKADGTRYFLSFLCVEGEYTIYLFNRKFKVAMKIPLRGTFPVEAFEGSLFDVELLANGTMFIFDCMAVFGNSVRHLNYIIRLEIARSFLSRSVSQLAILQAPQNHAMAYPSNYPLHLAAQLSADFQLQVKNVFYCHHLQQLQAPPYATDGFNFTSMLDPYAIFKENLLSNIKWKPIQHITIDFLMLPSSPHSVWHHHPQNACPAKYRPRSGNTELWTQHKKQNVLFCRTESKTHATGQIGEFTWKEGGWRLVKIRSDKNNPNQLQTVTRTITNIDEYISFADLG